MNDQTTHMEAIKPPHSADIATQRISAMLTLPAKHNEELEKLEFESLQQEKRDKMNARLQIWSLFFGLVSGFGLVSLQANAIGYLAALYPLLATCLARYAGHSEDVLDQIKAYLVRFERVRSYNGYECYNKANKRRSSGNHKTALRDALVLTELLATGIVTARLYLDHFALPILAVVIVLEAIAVVITFRCLAERRSS